MNDKTGQRPARNVCRRDLLRVGLGAAGAAAASGASGQEADQEALTAEDLVESRYRRTPHVERFYFLNRL